MKFCTKCNICKQSSDFGKKSESIDGLKSECKACRKLYNIEYRLRNKDKLKENTSKWYASCKEDVLKRKAEYYQEHKDEIKLKKRQYISSNRDRVKSLNSDYRCRRYATDVAYKLGLLLRNRLNLAISNNYKCGSAIRNLGCTIEEFKIYMESLFQHGMSWDNWGKYGWHIDHIVPLSSAKSEQELIKLCHYTNLQPLWAKDNLSKGAKIL